MVVSIEYMTIGYKPVRFLFPNNKLQFTESINQYSPVLVLLHKWPRAHVYRVLNLAAVNSDISYCIIDMHEECFKDHMNFKHIGISYLMYYENGVQMPVPESISALFLIAVEIASL
ncbi:hypothetical protein J3B02_000033 [Coemansia erecta]|nr:hypothetical protein J3B02_000033 [Coemansia erecta]KAJ2884466.1 hypothetical protein FB639_001951 [Coemansia asiatica]